MKTITSPGATFHKTRFRKRVEEHMLDQILGYAGVWACGDGGGERICGPRIRISIGVPTWSLLIPCSGYPGRKVKK